MSSDFEYMKMAFDLAELGRKTVAPNPMVGAVIVKGGEIIGKGHHKKSGNHHAEINAMNDAKGSLEGSTLYCTLEPCCHTNKKTPPCVPEIIKAGISKVVIANMDPNPDVSGEGVRQLKEAGLEVISGVMEKEGFEQNKVFFKCISKNLPYVHVKAAMTLDGRMATSTNDSKWITSEHARKEVHEMRMEYDGVMVGSGTAKADDPELTARFDGKVVKVPKRIVVGKESSLDKGLKLLSDKYANSTIVVQKDSLKESLSSLFVQGVRSILVEGGPKLISSLINEGLVDEYSFYIAPKLIGNGPSVFNHDKFHSMSEAIKLSGSWRDLGNGEAVFEGKLY